MKIMKHHRNHKHNQ